jgi:hypothetical protein
MKLGNAQNWTVIGMIVVLGILILTLGWYVINANYMASVSSYGSKNVSRFTGTEILPGKDRIFYLPVLKAGSEPAKITNYS